MRRLALMNQLFTCSIVKLVCWLKCFFCSSDGYGCLKKSNQSLNHRLTVGESSDPKTLNVNWVFAAWGFYSLFLSSITVQKLKVKLTDKFWNNQARSIFVACFGKSPRFLFELLLPPRDSVSESPHPDPPELVPPPPFASPVNGSENNLIYSLFFLFQWSNRFSRRMMDVSAAPFVWSY